jgi:hypothetical protein
MTRLMLAEDGLLFLGCLSCSRSAFAVDYSYFPGLSRLGDRLRSRNVLPQLSKLSPVRDLLHPLLFRLTTLDWEPEGCYNR